MAFDPTKNILRTNAGDPVPQIWDDTAQAFVVYEGTVEVDNFPTSIEVENTTGGSLDVDLKGNQVVEVLTEADATGSPAVTLTFSANISAIEIYHNESTVQNFTVNGITLVIGSGGWRSPVGGTAATTVTIPETVDCVVSRLV